MSCPPCSRSRGRERAPLVAQLLWQAVLNDLQLQMTRMPFVTWLRSTRLIAVQDGIDPILVHLNALAWLENRLQRQIDVPLSGM